MLWISYRWKTQFSLITEAFVQAPDRLFLVVTGLCLLLFLATVPLPRVDNQLVGSDGVRYYVYLPSLLLDRDLDFTDEYAYFYAYEPDQARRVINDRTGLGLPANQWSIGPAIFWLPFFILAHVAAHLANLFGADIFTDGYGYFYQTIVLSGNILYGGAGLWLTYRFVEKLARTEAALTATGLIALGGNLIYYLTAEPSMSHPLSVFTGALFFYTWFHRRNDSGVKTALIYGLLGGVMALVRPQDGLFLALPFLAEIPTVWYSLRGEKSARIWQCWLRNGVLAGVMALLIFSPQMVVWGKMYGSYFHIPYTYQAREQLFFWLSPRLGAVLFSAFRGLFVWHPVFLLALVGLLLTYRRDRMFAVVGALGFAMQWYLIASWHNWVQGDAFGGRMFIVCTPIFALGLAHLIEWGSDRWSWSTVFAVAGLLLFWNLLLFIEYRFDLATAQRPPTWYDLTVRRLTFPAEMVDRILR